MIRSVNPYSLGKQLKEAEEDVQRKHKLRILATEVLGEHYETSSKIEKTEQLGFKAITKKIKRFFAKKMNAATAGLTTTAHHETQLRKEIITASIAEIPKIHGVSFQTKLLRSTHDAETAHRYLVMSQETEHRQVFIDSLFDHVSATELQRWWRGTQGRIISRVKSNHRAVQRFFRAQAAQFETRRYHILTHEDEMRGDIATLESHIRSRFVPPKTRFISVYTDIPELPIPGGLGLSLLLRDARFETEQNRKAEHGVLCVCAAELHARARLYYSCELEAVSLADYEDFSWTLVKLAPLTRFIKTIHSKNEVFRRKQAIDVSRSKENQLFVCDPQSDLAALCPKPPCSVRVPRCLASEEMSNRMLLSSSERFERGFLAVEEAESRCREGLSSTMYQTCQFDFLEVTRFGIISKAASRIGEWYHAVRHGAQGRRVLSRELNRNTAERFAREVRDAVRLQRCKLNEMIAEEWAVEEEKFLDEAESSQRGKIDKRYNAVLKVLEDAKGVVMSQPPLPFKNMLGSERLERHKIASEYDDIFVTTAVTWLLDFVLLLPGATDAALTIQNFYKHRLEKNKQEARTALRRNLRKVQLEVIRSKCEKLTQAVDVAYSELATLGVKGPLRRTKPR
eukprot:TRINITY_DN14660_c0_g2_i1.p1 TRINITY_DN14660_c0_g2~~TRINITY_DN14660_c0_g2_i1.p1  ORF type:complete len:638 (+),score=90.07 TRINITY_DN14660_c0_g2_i1:41-1915(+)